MKNVVRGFSLVHDPEGSYYKISMKLIATNRKVKRKNQNEEGFCILICHFDFLYLIFNIVRDLVL